MINTPELKPSTPPGAGHSSFDLIDAGKLFQELNLAPGLTLADLGCGEGNYTLAAAEVIGEQGVIYALDLWQPGLEALERQAAARGRKNIRALEANLSQALPLAADSVDVALMATVLHDLVEFGLGEGALREAARVIKPQGTLAIVEFKKIDGPPGPPLHIRLTPAEVEQVVAPFGFKKTRVAEVGPYNYLILFVKERRDSFS
jgi:ubiquinone/menaquinone biosynthesis C-methylase UbiE